MPAGTAEPTFVYRFFGSSQPVVNALTAVLAESPPQDIQYRIGEDRVWLGVDNPDELRSTVMDTMEAIAPVVDTNTANLFAGLDDELLGLVFASDTRLIHTPEGIEFIPGEVVSYPEQMPNAFGGPAFPATTSIEVLDLVDEDGCVLLQQVTRPNPEQFSEVLAQSSLVNSDYGQFDGLEIGLSVVSQYDAGSGFFRSVEWTALFKTDAVETLEISRVVDTTEG